MNNNPYSYCNVEGQTDVGCVRKANEDWLTSFLCNNGLVAVVCDGMGGHVGGQVASHVAVETIQEYLSANYFEQPKLAIIESINAANKAILQRANQQPELKGMGSTCVMLIVRDGKVYIGSVGDSRVYLVRSKMIRQLTKDQSYVQSLVDSGQITLEQAEHHPRKNEITNALGLPNMEPATVLDEAIAPEAGDCFILCSDGLSGMVSDSKIAKVASDQANLRQKERVSKLIELARKNGGVDNITCQFVEFSVTPNSTIEPNIAKHKFIRYGIAGALAICVIAIVALFVLKKEQSADEKLDAELRKNGWVADNPQAIVKFVPGDTILAINEVKQYGAFDIFAKTINGDTDTLTINGRSFSLDHLTISPDSVLVMHRNGDQALISFKDHFSTELNYILLTFASGDSTFTYKYFVQMPMPDDSKSSSTTTSNNNHPSKRGGGRVLFEEKSGFAQIVKCINERDISFAVENQGSQTFTLSSASGTNTSQIAFFAEHKFVQILNNSISDETLTIAIDNSQCTLTVKNPTAVVGKSVKIYANNKDGQAVTITVRFNKKRQ